MARTDKTLQVKVPQFVHDDLKRLRDEVAADPDRERPSGPQVVGALIHAALADELIAALRKYRAAERAARNAEKEH